MAQLKELMSVSWSVVENGMSLWYDKESPAGEYKFTVTPIVQKGT